MKTQFIAGAIQVSPCSSAQVLSVFAWITTTLCMLSVLSLEKLPHWASFVTVIAYMTLLSILAFIRSKEDSTIWKCPVRDLPLDKILGRDSVTATLPLSRKSPVIYAPKPRYIIPPLLDCRSSRNSAYDSQPPVTQAKSAPVNKRSWYQPSIARGPTALYNSSVQKALVSADGSRAPVHPPPPPARTRQQKSPPPLGDWPRLDATTRPRTKRNFRSQNQDPLAGQTSGVPQHSSRRTMPSSAPSTTVPFVDRPPVPPRTPPQTKPPGSGLLGSMGSVDSESGSPSHRPPPLDLSKISTHRTRSERSRARSGGS